MRHPCVDTRGIVLAAVCTGLSLWLCTVHQKQTTVVVVHAPALGCFAAQPSPDCEGGFGYLSPHRRQTGFAPFDRPLRDPEACARTWATDAQNDQSVPPPFLQLIRLQEAEKARNIRQPFRSTTDEDLLIFYNFFSEMPYGSQHTYLELGAFDGITESNSRLFEYCAGWSGALIDGSPANFRVLAMPDVRPTAHKFHYVPSCHGFSTVDMLAFGNTGASSVDLHTDSMTSRVKQLTRTVHCAPLTTYLRHVGLSHIDFFSLDVEGAEQLVLETINFASGPVSFHVIMVESENRQCGKDCPKRDAVRALMQKAGFLLYTGIPRSDTFVNATMAQPKLGVGAAMALKNSPKHRGQLNLLNWRPK